MSTLFTKRGTEEFTELFLKRFKEEILGELMVYPVYTTTTDIEDAIEKKKEEVLEDTNGNDFIYDTIATVLEDIDVYAIINEITEALDIEEDY